MCKFRPDVKDVFNLLREKNALLVHFSGVPKGSGNDDLAYPADMQNVLRGEAQGGICCSTVCPQDKFPYEENANATGCVGVVVRPLYSNSIIDAHSDDCGSSINKDGMRTSRNVENTLTLDYLRSAIENRTEYNEWVVKDYESIGIFAVYPYWVWSSNVDVPKEIHDLPLYYDSSSMPGPKRSDLESIRRIFSGQRLFSFQDNEIVEYIDNMLRPVHHSQVYPVE